MGLPVSIRLDDDVRDELEAQARSRGIGLATTLRARCGGRASIARARPSAIGWPRTRKRGPFTRSGGRRGPMSGENKQLALSAGQIVLADWRSDPRSREPNKLRPAVVVGNQRLFAPNYPNAILVRQTEDATLVIPDLSVAIAPSPENGCPKPSGLHRTY